MNKSRFLHQNRNKVKLELQWRKQLRCITIKESLGINFNGHNQISRAIEGILSATEKTTEQLKLLTLSNIKKPIKL